MANELPYFRFTVQAWQNGDISLESYELKGLFIDICGYYWIKDCSITLAMLQKKISNTENIKKLIDLGIIKHENKHDKINIDFLNKQYDLLSEKRKRRQDAGSKGGNAKAMLKQKGSYKDNNKDNNKDKVKEINVYRKFKHLSISNNEFKTLEDTYTKQQIDETIDSIENFANNKKYTSLYLTARNWLKKEHPEKGKDCPYTETQIRLAKSQMQSGGGLPEWFDVKYKEFVTQ